MSGEGSAGRLPPGLASAWGFTHVGKRGPKPAHSVGQIVDAAAELADAGGFAALSMPRIARQLGLTANALYRYVSSRDELMMLLADAGWGPPPDSLPTSGPWRAAVTAWTRAMIDRFAVRPWLLDVPIQGAPVTPNLLRWLEVLLTSLAGSGLSANDLLGCAILFDGYARNTASLTRSLKNSRTSPVEAAAAMEFLRPLLQERGYPLLSTISAGGAYADDPEFADEEFGLERILDGVEVLIARRRPKV
jgi:AcrR family transcriptional regulator